MLHSKYSQVAKFPICPMPIERRALFMKKTEDQCNDVFYVTGNLTMLKPLKVEVKLAFDCFDVLQYQCKCPKLTVPLFLSLQVS